MLSEENIVCSARNLRNPLILEETSCYIIQMVIYGRFPV